MATDIPPRVVVADDSGLMRRVIVRALRDAGLDVVGEARDGDEALAQCRGLRPDAMTLDLAMPGLDGIGVLRRLRSAGVRLDVPVVVVSAFSPAHGARAVDALAEGAFDLVAKPSAGTGLQPFAAELAAKVRAAASSSRRATTSSRPATAGPRPPRPTARTAQPAGSARSRRLVVIASSTGGPRALASLVPRLPERLGIGTLLVQHMPAGFTGSLASRLDQASRLRVVEAGDGDAPAPDTALLAPGGRHLRLAGPHAVELSDDDAIGGLRPRADLTIADAARHFGRRLLLVVLTGMGDDGLAGAYAVRREGGRILAECEASCTIYGMPRQIVEAGLADEVLDLEEMPAAIAREAAA